MIKVFVYGTLKPGESNYQYYCGGKVITAQRAMVNGQLFDLPVGYPAMVPGDTLVQGYLLTFNDPHILQHLDPLEGHDPQQPPEKNFYHRKLMEIKTTDGESRGLAWAYWMTREQVQRIGGMLIPSGWWSGCGISPDE